MCFDGKKVYGCWCCCCLFSLASLAVRLFGCLYRFSSAPCWWIVHPKKARATLLNVMNIFLLFFRWIRLLYAVHLCSCHSRCHCRHSVLSFHMNNTSDGVRSEWACLRISFFSRYSVYVFGPITLQPRQDCYAVLRNRLYLSFRTFPFQMK